MNSMMGRVCAGVLGFASVLSLSAQQPPKAPPAMQPHIETTDLTFLIYSYPDKSQQELAVTDPSGRSIGKDALKAKVYTSAERATYSIEGQGDLDDISTPVVKAIRFVEPSGGTYRLRVTSKTAGHFDLYVTANCEKTVARRQILKRQIAAGSARSFSVRYDPDHCEALTLVAAGSTQHP